MQKINFQDLPNQTTPINATNLNAIQSNVETAIIGAVPVGAIMQWVTNTAPTNWLICDGRALSRTTYSALFSVIGTIYGAGDGSTTFNLPNFKGRIGVGKDSTQTEFDTLGKTGGEKTHTLTIAEMPSHNHGWKWSTHATQGTGEWSSDGSGRVADDVIANTGGGQPHNILQPYQVTNYIIKAV